jgi:hypothetical protein
MEYVEPSFTSEIRRNRDVLKSALPVRRSGNGITTRMVCGNSSGGLVE